MGRSDGHVGHQFIRCRFHERLRVSRFLQRPLDAIAEARLLVKVRPAFGREGADAAKYPIECSQRLFRGLSRRQVDARLREVLLQLDDDRVCEFIDVLRQEPVQQHGAAIICGGQRRAAA